MDETISATLLAAKEYVVRLKNLDCQLQNVENQVISTAENTEKNIESVFGELTQSLVQNLNKRKSDLLAETRSVKSLGLIPLQDCRAVILNALKETESLIANCGTLVESNGDISDKCVEEFDVKSSFLGLLPEVPDLNEVPYITLETNHIFKHKLLDAISNFGSICHIAPVKIASLTEKPGGILVEWQRVEYADKMLEMHLPSSTCLEDRQCEIEEYRLQKALGDDKSSKHILHNFDDCYIGPDTQYLVKDILTNEPYSFRVCCRYEGKECWSPWSLPQAASTRIKPFCWKDNDNVVLTNENKVAKSAIDTPLFLFSQGPQFKIGDNIEFLFLECGDVSEDTYVGLSDKGGFQSDDMLGEGTFCVKVNGEIYVDGVKKAMILSQARIGSKISFGAMSRSNNKMRISIDVNERRVTYDWVTDTKVLYFYAKLGNSKWKIMVE